ncbi:MAG: hypothetical protein RL701_8101, partial [Pseudomonadota bacterium]
HAHERRRLSFSGRVREHGWQPRRALAGGSVKPIKYAVALLCLTLVCCDMDDEPLKGGRSAVGMGSEDAGSDDGGPSDHAGPSSGNSDSTKAGRGAGTNGGVSAASGAPAAGSGGAVAPVAGAGGAAGQNAGGASGVAGTAGVLAAGSGGGNDTAGRGGPQKPECPAAAPSDGSSCEGIQGITCPYQGLSCRCRHSTPVWLCESTERAGRSGGSDAGNAASETAGRSAPGPGRGPR